MRKRSNKIRMGKSWEAYAFLMPWMIGLLAFTIIPMMMSLYFSFTRYDMANPPRWIGWENYINVFTDSRARNSLRVTFTFVFLSVPFQLCFALLLASVFKKNRRGISIYRAIYYLPSLLGGSVAVALLWRNMFGRDGFINRFLYIIFGIEGRSWIGHPDTALYTLVALALWQFGGSMVIFLGGLKNISTDYYEAAEIDGANRVQLFLRITMPLLTPMIFFNLVMNIIGAFQAFTSAFIVSGGGGGPVDSTMFFSLLLYIRAFEQFNMGLASAMAWVLLLIIGFFTVINFALSKKWVHYDE